jgi:regulation of enolase protein 1 (concanavalin A-like superfamily)
VKVGIQPILLKCLTTRFSNDFFGGSFMKCLNRIRFAAIFFACLALARVQAQPLGNQKTQLLGRWGAATDPDGDCKFFATKRELLVAVPAACPHDLAADIDRTNAPRVLQRACGDFAIQVRVDGRFDPGDASAQSGRGAYNGAGIIAMADDNNVVTLARAALQEKDDAQSYANFEIRSDGHLERIGLTSDHPLAKDRPTYLRLERRGRRFLAATSEDGQTWVGLDSKRVPSDWPQELQIGIVAVSTSKAEFNPRFSKLQVLK